MKLSQDQIQELYKFTSRRLVKHYDLQSELVDHLANGIEEQWSINPEITFKDGLKNEFAKFGHFGFRKIIKMRKREMTKRDRVLIWKHITEYIKLPKILGSLLSVLALTLVFTNVHDEYRVDVFIGTLFLISFMVLFVLLKKRNDYELEQVRFGKKWMLKEQIFNVGYIPSIVNIFPIILNLTYFRNMLAQDNIVIDISIAILTVSLSLFSYVIIFVIPRKADKILTETYPEYKLINR